MIVMVFVSILAMPAASACIVAMDPMVMVVMTRYPYPAISVIPVTRPVIIRSIPN
jgi:hypothetical protein